MKSRLTVGERVAWYRRRRGLSQEALAGLVGRTADWLQKAERNRISLDRVSVLRDLADVLGVTVAHLLGDEGQLEPRRSREFDITAIRMALTSYGQVLEPPSVRSVARLETDLDALWEAYQDSRFGYMALRLPALVNEVRAAAACPTGRDRGRAAEIVSLTYQAATALLTKLGDVDLAWVSADRGLHTAHQTGNPVIIGSLSRSVVHALQSTGRHEEAVALVDSTASYLGVNLRRADRVSISVYGSLFLAGAVAAARLGDRSTAQTYLAHAEAAADEMPGDDNALWTSFGPTNVAIHRVTAMMEFGDAQPALDLGVVLDISSLPVERRVRHTLEIARARCLRNQRDEALSTLLSAEQMAPQQVRVHFLARQIARTLVRGSRRRPSGELSALATRLQALS